MDNPLAADLDRLLALDPALYDPLRDARILLTGGTGFFGGWLLEALLRATWLWTLLARGESARPYDVGSEHAVSISELAQTVARVLGVARGVVAAKEADPSRPAERCVPSTRRARKELGLRENFPLELCISRMAEGAGRAAT